MSAPVAEAMRRAFALYREHMEVARDPDEAEVNRRRSRQRAANARARLERQIARVEASGL